MRWLGMALWGHCQNAGCGCLVVLALPYATISRSTRSHWLCGRLFSGQLSLDALVVTTPTLSTLPVAERLQGTLALAPNSH